jgi:hypothetical protein
MAIAARRIAGTSGHRAPERRGAKPTPDLVVFPQNLVEW